MSCSSFDNNWLQFFEFVLNWCPSDDPFMSCFKFHNRAKYSGLFRVSYNVSLVQANSPPFQLQ